MPGAPDKLHGTSTTAEKQQHLVPKPSNRWGLRSSLARRGGAGDALSRRAEANQTVKCDRLTVIYAGNTVK